MIRATTPWLTIADLLGAYRGLNSFEDTALAAVTRDLGAPPTTYGIERDGAAPGRIRFAATWAPGALAAPDPPEPPESPADPLPGPDPRPDPPPGVRIEQCRSCGSPIWWTLSKNGRPTPNNVDPKTRQPTDQPHWATCPHAKSWSRKPASGGRHGGRARGTPL